MNGWSRVFPNNDIALKNIQAMALPTGSVLARRDCSTRAVERTTARRFSNQQWYRESLFGAAASWQAGEASIDDFEKASAFSSTKGDATGKIDAAQMKLHGRGTRSSPRPASAMRTTISTGWTRIPRKDNSTRRRCGPISRDFRVLAESAMVLVAQARQVAKGKLRETDALESLEMEARGGWISLG